MLDRYVIPPHNSEFFSLKIKIQVKFSNRNKISENVFYLLWDESKLKPTKAFTADGPHRSLGLFKSHSKPSFPTEQLMPHRTPLKVLLCQKPWRALGVGCVVASEGVLLGGHRRSRKEITDLHSEFWIHWDFKEQLWWEGTAPENVDMEPSQSFPCFLKSAHVVKRPVFRWYILLYIPA